MSKFSGKCDLYDHMMMEKHRTADGSDDPEEIKKAHVLYSDELECFEIFKQKTGGVIHQHQLITVTEQNQMMVAEKCDHFEVIEYFDTVPDKRKKGGYRNIVTYTYRYWGRDYDTLKELNKHGVYITIDIHFDTILDLIPYYPYVIAMSYSSEDSEYVVISKKSFVLQERDEMYDHGYDSKMWEGYNKKLQDHYREIVLRYFNPEGREHIEEVVFDENRQAKVSKPIDENFDVKWYWDEEIKNHWSSPKVVDYEKGLIEMSLSDYGTDAYKGFLGHTMKVKYVEKKEYPLYLG